MMNPALFMGPVAVAAVIVAYVFALRTRYHYVSTLTCPRCQRAFSYGWVPLASFSAVRLVNRRYLECPSCHEWSTFDIKSTMRRAGDVKASAGGASRPDSTDP
jgi:hypothetical protein